MTKEGYFSYPFTTTQSGDRELCDALGISHVSVALSVDSEAQNGFWNGTFKKGDVGFRYELLKELDHPYETIEHTGHVLYRDSCVVSFMSYRIGPEPVSEIINFNARKRAEVIVSNIERILRETRKN